MKRQVYRKIKDSTESLVHRQVAELVLEGWKAEGSILKYTDRKTGDTYYFQGVTKGILTNC